MQKAKNLVFRISIVLFLSLGLSWAVFAGGAKESEPEPTPVATEAPSPSPAPEMASPVPTAMPQ